MVRLSIAATLAAFAGVASAQLKITAPSSDIWWVAQSVNVMEWNCQESPYTNFTVLINNTSPSILIAPQAFIAIQMNGDCSKEVTQQQANQAPSTGYTLLFANPFNSSDVYATSEEFEIKPLGSQYPSQVTPTAHTSQSNGTSTSTDTASTPSKTNAASSLGVSLGLGLAAFGATLGLMA